MKAESFCYWLQGFFEMAEPKTLSAEQVKMLRAHLHLVFQHDIDPAELAHLPPEKAEAKAAELQEIHDKGKKPAHHPYDALARC